MTGWSHRALSSRLLSGFTLVELMVSMTLGLVLISLMVGTIDKVMHASRVSAEAAETIERGYFLMDAMDTWVAETSPMPHGLFSDVSAELTTPILGQRAQAFVDLCDSPDIAALPEALAGIVLLEPSAWPCIPQRNLEASAPGLLLEHRLPCRKNCNDAGFFAIPEHCHVSGEVEQSEANRSPVAYSGDSQVSSIEFVGHSFDDIEFDMGERLQYQIVWLDAGHDRPPCFANGRALKLTRSLIYVRDYAWRVGDGIRAVMVRDLAQEPEARWLRSSMLAHGIDDWQVACLFDCFVMGALSNRALLAATIELSFVVEGRSQSIRIQRALAPRRSTGQ